MSGRSGGRIASHVHAIPLLNSKLLNHSVQFRLSKDANQLPTTSRRSAAAVATAEGSTSASFTDSAATSVATTDLVATLATTPDETGVDVATIDDVTDWFRLSYRTMYSRSNVRAKVERAQTAMLAVDPSRQILSLQRDILPKTQVRLKARNL